MRSDWAGWADHSKPEFVRQGHHSFSHKLNSKASMPKRKRARDKKVDEVLAQEKLEVKFERLKADTWVVLKLRPQK